MYTILHRATLDVHSHLLTQSCLSIYTFLPHHLLTHLSLSLIALPLFEIVTDHFRRAEVK